MTTVLHLLPHRGGGAETYIDLLEQLDGFEHDRVSLSTTRSRWGGPPSIIGRWHRTSRRAREADVVHVHGDTAAMLAAPMLRRRPSVITTHGLHRLRRSAGLRLTLVRRRLCAAVAAADRVICTSRSERGELAAVLPPHLAVLLTVIPNGVPVRSPITQDERVRARAALGIGSGEVATLYVGRLEERKDPLAAVAAAESARARGASVVLLVAGEGPLASAVANRAGAGLRPLGVRDDVRTLYSAADLFVLPSKREGTSMALLEAMSCGLPVLVSEANAEAVADAGLRVPTGDVEALTDRLVELAVNPGLRGRLGAAARQRATRELGVDGFLSRTREVYEGLRS